MAKRFNLKQVRTEHNLLQSDVALMLDVPQSKVSAMENGRTTISQDVVDTLKEKFEIENIEEYFNLDEIVKNDNRHGRGINTGEGSLSYEEKTAESSAVNVRLKHIESKLTEYNEQLKKSEAKREELLEENRKLYKQIVALSIRCAKSGIDIADIDLD